MPESPIVKLFMQPWSQLRQCYAATGNIMLAIACFCSYAIVLSDAGVTKCEVVHAALQSFKEQLAHRDLECQH